MQYLYPILTKLLFATMGLQVLQVKVLHRPDCITSVCVADDNNLLSGSKSSLQAALNIAEHYSKRYRVVYNAWGKKLVVSGSPIDRQYYSDTQPWVLNDKRITVQKTLITLAFWYQAVTRSNRILTRIL